MLSLNAKSGWFNDFKLSFSKLQLLDQAAGALKNK
jgi:hypothetical protein